MFLAIDALLSYAFIDPVGYGPGKRLSFEEYHAIPDGWEIEHVLEAYRRLEGRFDIMPLQVRPDANAWFFYRQVISIKDSLEGKSENASSVSACLAR